MTYKKTFFASISSMLLLASALQAHEGFYIGAEAGAGILSRTPRKNDLKRIYSLDPAVGLPNGFPGAANSKRDQARFLGGLHGGYNFNVDEQLMFAPQIGFRYVQKAQFKASNFANVFPLPASFTGELFKGSHELNIVDLLAIGTYQINPLWDIQGKIGAAYVMDKIKIDFKAYNDFDVSAYNKSKTKKSFRPEVGLGVGYRFHENMRISLDAMHLFGSKSKASNIIQGTASAAEVAAKQQEFFNKFNKVPSLTSITVSLQYMF